MRLGLIYFVQLTKYIYVMTAYVIYTYLFNMASTANVPKTKINK